MRTWTLGRFVSLSMIVIALIFAGCNDAHDHGSNDGHHTDETAVEDTVQTSGIINSTCPIMKSKIDPTKVPESLTRKWKGQTVGFCCAGCPAAWDKLNETEKDKKLKAAGTPNGGDHDDHDSHADH